MALSLSRKEALPLIGLALFPILACKQADTQKGVPPLKQKVSPTEQPTSPKTLVEKELSPVEEKAMEAAFYRFWRVIEGSQRTTNGEFLASTITNRGSYFADRAPIGDIIRGKIPPQQSLLQVRWVHEEQGATAGTTRRTYGDAEFQNIHVKLGTVYPLSEEDSKNGLQWKGKPQVLFQVKYRLLKPHLEGGGQPISDSLTDPQWARRLLLTPQWDFREEDGQFNVPLMLKGGKWIDDLQVYGEHIVYPLRSYSFERANCNVREPIQPPGCEVVWIKR